MHERKASDMRVQSVLGVFFVLVLLPAAAARAEHGCPDGHIPVFQGANRNCVADYGLPYWKDRPVPGRVQPTYIWKDRYTTLAWAQGKRPAIVLTNQMKSARASEAAALKECRRLGDSDCVIVDTARNGCIAVAGWDDPDITVMSRSAGSTREEVIADAEQRCAAKNKGTCRATRVGCGLPAQGVSFW